MQSLRFPPSKRNHKLVSCAPIPHFWLRSVWPHLFIHRDLYLLFRRFGTILSAQTIVHRITGLSKGFGFISFSTKEEAQAAIAEMNGFRVYSWLLSSLLYSLLNEENTYHPNLYFVVGQEKTESSAQETSEWDRWSSHRWLRFGGGCTEPCRGRDRSRSRTTRILDSIG